MSSKQKSSSMFAKPFFSCWKSDQSLNSLLSLVHCPQYCTSESAVGYLLHDLVFVQVE